MEEQVEASGGELLAEIRNGIAKVTLNRPPALNALTFGMILGLAKWLDEWEMQDRVRVVVFRGAGEKAFCAGGDLRSLYNGAKAAEPRLLDFFVAEYALDYRIHTYSKPIVAVIDGIVMGGGMGISQGAGLRLAGERTRMAMPETSIGLFPDVGGSYFLSRAPGKLGLYLGLAGPTIRAADAIYCGLADDYIGTPPLPAPELETMRPAIDEHFARASVPAIVASLRDESRPQYRDWADTTLQALAKKSPLLLAVAFEQIRRGATMTLADCFRMELGLVHACFEQGDFLEGIRALIVEKDNTPRWNPDLLEAVTPDMVAAFFAPRWKAAEHPLAHLPEQQR